MVTIEFRDGRRDVPEHVAVLLSTIETYTLTFEQAMEKANKSLMTDYITKVQARTVADHLNRFGR